MIQRRALHLILLVFLLTASIIAPVLLWPPLAIYASPPLPPCPPPPATPGIPPAPIPCDEEPVAGDEEPVAGDLCLRLVADPSSATSPSTIVTYELTLANSSDGKVSGKQVVFSFDGRQQEIVDVYSTNPNVWVNELLTSTVKLRFEHIDSSTSLTAALRLRSQLPMRIDETLSARAFLMADSELIYSNQIVLRIEESPVSNPTTSLVVTPSIGTPSTVSIASNNTFASNERVGLWYHSPDGQVVSVGETRADALGKLSVSLPATSLIDGQYKLVAQGVCSGSIAVGAFTVMEDYSAKFSRHNTRFAMLR